MSERELESANELCRKAGVDLLEMEGHIAKLRRNYEMAAKLLVDAAELIASASNQTPDYPGMDKWWAEFTKWEEAQFPFKP